MKPRNLYEQTTELTRSALAAMLGFDYSGDSDKGACGFRIALREIPAFPNDDFTMGQALDAYLAHMVACRARSMGSWMEGAVPSDAAN
ncbi:hypothetical protein [Burkholderia cenocepacia]